jgi:hypothetical protein
MDWLIREATEMKRYPCLTGKIASPSLDCGSLLPIPGGKRKKKKKTVVLSMERIGISS